MNMIKRLADEKEWMTFLEYKKEQGNISENDAADLESFIVNKEYKPVVHNIKKGIPFAPPRRTLINKSKAGSKRAVYTFSREENYVLKLLAFLLRDYDNIFAPNLYSFRKERGVKRAAADMQRIKDLSSRYVYRVDISDYFGSVSTELLIPELREVLSADPKLFDFIQSLLRDPFVMTENGIEEERKGIMAGVPISAFLANLYLRELDFFFANKGIPYIRYSDDIAVFAENEEQLSFCIERIGEALEVRGLSINKEKEVISRPNEQWSFLGFSYHNGIIDISPVSYEKLKSKMRRKTRALMRWANKKGVPGERAAAVFVRKFNAKLYNNPVYNELTWARWFFPIINTDSTLKRLDAYMQDCIRTLATGKRTKARFNFTYENIKSLGYISLVNEYYKQKSAAQEGSAEAS